MRKIIYICDRCGKEMTGLKYQLAVRWGDKENNDPENWEMEYGAELCEECYRAVDEAILAAIKNEKPERKATREPAISDFGKLKALLRAGWKIKDVALEFRCSEQTVRNTIKRLQDMDLGIEEEEA